MSRRKVMTIVGTRPELIKLSRVIAVLDQHLEHVLVHTGQNFDFELNQIFFQELGIRRPDHFLEAAGEGAIETIANVLVAADRLLEQERPDAVLFYGDTNSCLAVIAAKRRKVPVFHMEAGNRSFDQRVPEELNRKVVDHLSDVNMTLTEHARRYLLAEGLPPERVMNVGSSMPEVLAHHKDAIEAADPFGALGVAPGQYFVASLHREENVDSPRRLERLLECLEGLAARYDQPVVVSTHPRTRKRLEARTAASGRDVDPRVRFLKPFGFFEYVRLQQAARCVVSDSGSVTEEASLLGFPAVTVRDAHERPEGMDRGVLVMVGLDVERVLEAVEVTMAQFGEGGFRPLAPPDYGPLDVSQKVLRIVLSYIDYVDRTVWHKAGDV